MRFKKTKIVSAMLVATMFLNTTGITALAESNVTELETETNVEMTTMDNTELEDETGTDITNAESSDTEEHLTESDIFEEILTELISSEDETTEAVSTEIEEITTETVSSEIASTEMVSMEEETTETNTTEKNSVEDTSTEETTTESSSTEELTIEETEEDSISSEIETVSTEEMTTEETEEDFISSEIETEIATETTEEETTEEITTEETTTEVSTESTDVLFPGLSENYTLSAKQLKDKSTLASYTDEISELEEESEQTNIYAKGEVVYLTDSREDAQEVAEAFGGTLERFGDGVAVIKLSQERTVSQAIKAAASKFYHLPAVWPNYYYQLFEEYNDPALKESSKNYQWAHEYIGDQYAWEKGYKGDGVKIGIIDSGVHSTHEDLQENVAQNLTMVPEGGAATTTDPEGHGTHVAGIAAAVGNNGKGGAGIAPGAQIYAYSVMDSEGIMKNDYILRAINRAIDDGVDVINMSLGSGYYNGNEENIIKKSISKWCCDICCCWK